jgi:hypothetical protein
VGHLLVPVLLGVCLANVGLRAWESRSREAEARKASPAVVKPVEPRGAKGVPVSEVERPTLPRG